MPSNADVFDYSVWCSGELVYLRSRSQGEDFLRWLNKTSYEHGGFKVCVSDGKGSSIRRDSIHVSVNQDAELFFSSAEQARSYVQRATVAIDAAISTYLDSTRVTAAAKSLLDELPSEQVKELFRQYQPEDPFENAKQAIAKLAPHQIQKLLKETAQAEQEKSKRYFSQCTYAEVAPLFAKLFEERPGFHGCFHTSSTGIIYFDLGIREDTVDLLRTTLDETKQCWVEKDSSQAPLLVYLHPCK